MSDRNHDRNNDRLESNPRDEDDLYLDGEGLHPSGEGLSETPIHETYEAIALRNDLVRQLEGAVGTARAWARADGSPEAEEIADAISEAHERVGEPNEP